MVEKEVVGFYISIKIKKQFEEYCEKNYISKGKIIEKILKEFLKNAKT